MKTTTGLRPHFAGTGGGLFRELFVGYLLCVVTLGIYTPWFACRLQRYFCTTTTIGPTERGDLTLSFSGHGGALLVTWLVGFGLTIVTAGLYGPWFFARITRFFVDNTAAQAEDGTEYRLRFEASGSEIFGEVFVAYLLLLVTLGLYAPWLVCRLSKLIARTTHILENGEAVGHFDFVGTGGSFASEYIVGYLFTVFTLGIYGPWFMVRMIKFFSRNTHGIVRDRVYRGDFTGAGGELLVTYLLGMLLTVVTVGIYGFWFLAKLIRFQVNNLAIVDTGERAGENMPRAVIYKR